MSEYHNEEDYGRDDYFVCASCGGMEPHVTASGSADSIYADCYEAQERILAEMTDTDPTGARRIVAAIDTAVDSLKQADGIELIYVCVHVAHASWKHAVRVSRGYDVITGKTLTPADHLNMAMFILRATQKLMTEGTLTPDGHTLKAFTDKVLAEYEQLCP